MDERKDIDYFSHFTKYVANDMVRYVDSFYKVKPETDGNIIGVTPRNTEYWEFVKKIDTKGDES